METAIVYWYRLKSHVDPFTEGYIGVTTNPHKRHIEHIRNAAKGTVNHLYNAIRLYGVENIEREVLFTGSIKDAYLQEWLYRQSDEIGWNHATGGSNGAMQKGKSIQLYHQSNIVILLSFSSIKEAAKATNQSAKALAKQHRAGTTTYNKLGWAILHNSMFDRTTTLTVNQLLSSKLLGKPKNSVSPLKGLTNRWTAEQKAIIGSHHKGKVIPKEQVERLREHNRNHSPACIPIELKHVDNPNQLYKYHSMSEASRQLQIPLSRLKSKVQRKLNVYGKDGWAVHSYNT